jgi:hypothetical protein
LATRVVRAAILAIGNAIAIAVAVAIRTIRTTITVTICVTYAALTVRNLVSKAAG